METSRVELPSWMTEQLLKEVNAGKVMNEIPTLRMSIKLGRARKGKRGMGEGKREMQNEMELFVSLPSRGYLSSSHHYKLHVCVLISISVV